MEATKKASKIRDIRVIEHHLRNYRTYKAGIKNLQRQLDFIMPNVTATYGVDMEGSTGTFDVSSKVEKIAIDRIEGKRALDLHEDIRQYEIIIESIDIALEEVEETEQEFIENRYFEGRTVKETSIEMGYGEKHIFNVRNRLFNKLLISLRSIVNLSIGSA